MPQENHNELNIDHLSIGELTTEKFKKEYKKPGIPLVMTDLIQGGVDWDLDFLSAHLGDREFAVRDYGEGHFDKPRSEWSKYCDHSSMSIKEFGRHLEDGSAKKRNLYLAQNPIAGTRAIESIGQELDYLQSELGFQPVREDATLNLWVGPAGHAEPLHFDPSDGTLIQLHGKKKIILFPPKQTSNLYPFGFYDVLPFWVSQVDLDKPDLHRYPKYEQAKQQCYEVVLEPGQALYIPTGWWHEVIAVGDEGYVCSCNFFWKVNPARRNFQTLQASVLYLMNKIPWNWVMRFNRFIYGFKKQPPVAAE